MTAARFDGAVFPDAGRRGAASDQRAATRGSSNRSFHGTRLKKNHQTRNSSPPTPTARNCTMNFMKSLSNGTLSPSMRGTMSRVAHMTATMTTAGQTRGRRGAAGIESGVAGIAPSGIGTSLMRIAP